MAVILTDFRIFRKIITQIGDIFFSQKIVATLYQSKPVISSTPSLNVDQNCRFFIQPVGRASFLSCKTMMRLFPRAGWNWRLQRGLQVDLLGGGAPLGLPDHIPAAPPQCPPRNHLDNEPSQQWGRGWEGKELSKCDIWPRMVIILTDFWIFTKKLSIGDIFSHKNGCHLPLNSHENWWTFYTTTNTPKKSISGCIRFNFLPNNHSVRHSKTHGLDKIITKNQDWWQFTHWKCHQNWWKIIHQKKWKF